MISFTLKNDHVLPAFNAAMGLQQWLRPGLLAYIVGSHAEELKPHATRLFTERNAILDEAALKYPATVDDPAGFRDGDTVHQLGEPHPKAGQHVTYEMGGNTITRFRSPEAGDEFKRRERELMDASTTITVDERLTFEHIKRIDAERLVAPRAAGGVAAIDAPVDFASLSYLVRAPMARDPNGMAVPASPPTLSLVPPAAVP